MSDETQHSTLGELLAAWRREDEQQPEQDELDVEPVSFGEVTMMRTLKFRAWSTSQKRMYDRVLAGPGDPCSIVWDDERKDWLHFDEHCGEIMQYIGLDDANGQEIYEDDIIEIEGATAKVVYWEQPPEFGLDASHNEEDWCDDWNLCDDHERMEIVGNVHENPGLLNK